MTKQHMQDQIEEAQRKIDEGRAILEEVAGELQSKWERRSKKFRESEEGEERQAVFDGMNDDVATLEEIGQKAYEIE